MINNEIEKYLKGVNAPNEVYEWVETHTQKKPQSEVEHIIDYLTSDKAPKRLEKATYIQMKSNTDKWVKVLHKKARHIKESSEDTELVLDFKDGFKIVKLIGENAYKREGFLMRHCSASYFKIKDDTLYSLRDSKNMPHATMSKNSQQIKGKGNGSIHPTYIKYVVKFLESEGFEVKDNEMKNLGYINLHKWKKYLHKDLVEKMFKKKYHFKDDKLIDKNGKDWFCLDLLDSIPLVKENNFGLKINLNLPLIIKCSLSFMFNQKKKTDSSKLASSGYSSKLTSSGDYSQLASSGESSKLASSGDYSKLASSGYSSKLASSGYSSKLASSGDSSKLASSGDYSQLASSGDYSKLASSGDSSKLASSGEYSKLASSGDYSQLASSGEYSQLASSGDYSQLELTGIDSIGANIGVNGKIKGIKGCWITLAEHDSAGCVLFVKTEKIDGKKIKENVWYKLKNKRFVEVN